MKEILVPEVIQTKLKQHRDSKTLNLTLKNIDKRNYSINHEHYTQNNTTTTNVNKGGFFRFILEVITLPFKIIFKSTSYIFKKYDLKEKFKLELISVQKDRWKRKWLKKQRSVWNNDEVF